MKQIVFVILTFFGAVALAGDGDMPCRKEDKGLHLQKELNLSSQQKEKIKLLHDKYSPLIETKTKEMKALKGDLTAQLQSPDKSPVAKTALMEKFKKFQAARHDLGLTRFELALETRDLLTEEQIKKFKAVYDFKGRDDHRDKAEKDTKHK